MTTQSEQDRLRPEERSDRVSCGVLDDSEAQVLCTEIDPSVRLASIRDLTRLAARPDPARCPVTTYLHSLSRRSRYTMERSLVTILRVVSGRDTIGHGEVFAFPWSELRFQHTAAIRSALAERYSSVSTVNLHLAALRGVLVAAWRLGMIDGPDYQRAVDIASLKGCALPKGRSLYSLNDPGTRNFVRG